MMKKLLILLTALSITVVLFISCTDNIVSEKGNWTVSFKGNDNGVYTFYRNGTLITTYDDSRENEKHIVRYNGGSGYSYGEGKYTIYEDKEFQIPITSLDQMDKLQMFSIKELQDINDKNSAVRIICFRPEAITKVEITVKPTNNQYVGKVFDPTGMLIDVIFMDGTTLTSLTNFTTNYDNTPFTVAQDKFLITGYYGGKSFEIEQNILNP